MPAMVDPAAALTLVLATLPLMASPGPATLSIAGMSASQGLGPSLPFSFGVVSGSAAAALLVATGVTGALWALPGAAPVIQAVGLAYLLYLAYRIATAPVGAAAGTRAASWLPGLALAIANPKVYAAIGAVFSGHILIAGQATPDAIAKLTVLVVLMLLVHAVWWLFGAALAQQMRDPRRGRRLNLVFAAALVLSIILALV